MRRRGAVTSNPASAASSDRTASRITSRPSRSTSTSTKRRSGGINEARVNELARAVLTIVGGPSAGEKFSVDPDPSDKGRQGWLISIQTPIGPAEAARVVFENQRYYIQDVGGKFPRRP